MFATVLLTDPQVDALVVVGQLLQRERDTHPVRGGAVEETVELHSDSTYGRSMNDDWGLLQRAAVAKAHQKNRRAGQHGGHHQEGEDAAKTYAHA
ncbi:hypothetical protein D9M71_553040 [compost metagenome]